MHEIKKVGNNEIKRKLYDAIEMKSKYTANKKMCMVFCNDIKAEVHIAIIHWNK